jgi:hypothetical protein
MSFNQNDNTQSIHLGNYEEFFILYMDNELSEEQVKMVDEFLIAHPDLQAELEILLSTKLPVEDFSFNKEDLLAENMKISSVDEELLLYIDNELTKEQKKAIELELTANKDYYFQHELLLKTKLNASEHIAYPNKEELYHRTERRIVAFRPWMRVAAAVVVMTTAGILYFNNGHKDGSAVDHPQTIANKTSADPATEKKNVVPVVRNKAEQILANADQGRKLKQHNPVVLKNRKEDQVQKQQQPEKQDLTILTPPNETQADHVPERTVRIIDFNGITKGNSEITALNNPTVTSSVINRKTDVIPTGESTGKIADSHKGSVKGFLRQATRVIEKRTGIDPTNENGELLIGVVAVKLK